jgi:hypothetical protein
VKIAVENRSDLNKSGGWVPWSVTEAIRPGFDHRRG